MVQSPGHRDGGEPSPFTDPNEGGEGVSLRTWGEGSMSRSPPEDAAKDLMQ